jgi:hypothetical protein
MWRFVVVGIAVMVISILWYATMVASVQRLDAGDGIVGLLTIVLAVMAYRSGQQKRVHPDIVVSPVHKLRTDVPTFMPVITATDVARWRQLAAPETLAATPAITDRLPVILLPVTTPFHEWIVQPTNVASVHNQHEVLPAPIDWQALGVADTRRPWYVLKRYITECWVYVAMGASALWFVVRLMG